MAYLLYRWEPVRAIPPLIRQIHPPHLYRRLHVTFCQLQVGQVDTFWQLRLRQQLLWKGLGRDRPDAGLVWCRRGTGPGLLRLAQLVDRFSKTR
jgi:hypothetical protein